MDLQRRPENMNQHRSTKRSFDLSSIFELPPIVFYSGLGIVCFILFAMSWPGNGANEQSSQISTAAHHKHRSFQSSPDPAPKKSDVYQSLLASGGENVSTARRLNEAVKLLEQAIKDQVVTPSAAQPGDHGDWISESFVANAMDRTRFQPKFADGQFKVQRWRRKDSPPIENSNDSLQEFVSAAMTPWIGAHDFEIGIEVYAFDVKENKLIAKLVSEVFGKTQDHSRQSTGIWTTGWRMKNQRLILESIEMEAVEEVRGKLGHGKLMLDYTASILQHCDSLANQLAFGLDQWARRIPSLDIVGNHGLALGDINQDGLDDIYVCQPHGLPNLLFIQNPDGTVKDASQFSRLDILDESHAALILDLDNDHDQDLVVSTDENLLLLSNTGKGKFQLEHQLPIGKNTHSIAAADFDQDGDLDLFLCKFQDVNRQNDLLVLPTDIDTANDGGRNVLLRNEEGWIFRDVTEEVGFTRDNQFYTRSAAWADYDQDGDQDLYVTNEFASDQLFENQSGWFTDRSAELGIVGDSRHRSVSVGEFNQDGRVDFFVASDAAVSAIRLLHQFNSPSNDLLTHRQQWFAGESRIWQSTPSQGPFHPFFLRTPIFSSQSAFGSAAADLNNDGLDDLIVTNGGLTRDSSTGIDDLFFAQIAAAMNDDGGSKSHQIARAAHDVSHLCRIGHSYSGQQRNRCFLNLGELGFSNVSGLAGVDFPDDARAIATTDWDGDGDADLVMTCRGGPQLRVLCNQLNSENGFVHFDLVGTQSNADAIGARIELYLHDRPAPLVKVLQAGSGNLSQSTKRLMFGIGSNSRIERAVVVWPSGQAQSFEDITSHAHYRIVEGDPQPQTVVDAHVELAISADENISRDQLPPVNRAWFYPRPPLPRIQYQPELGKWAPLEPSTDRPSVVFFCSTDSNSQDFLQRQSNQLGIDQVDGTVLFIGDESDEPAQRWKREQAIIEECQVPFRWGSAAPDTQHKIAYFMGEWFHHQNFESLPFAVLIDMQGNVCGFYPGATLDPAQLAIDIRRIGLPVWQTRGESAPLGGQWIARHRTPKLNRLRSRLNEVGYREDSDRLAAASIPQRAVELCHKAIELDSQGQTDRARRFLRQAILLDSQCVLALVTEGTLLRRIALEQSTENPEIRHQIQRLAAEDFSQALTLDPLNSAAIIGKANIAIDQNRIDQALEQLFAFLELEPNRYEVHAIIGRLLFYQKNDQQAAEFLVTAFDNRPTLPYVAGDLGFLYLKTGKFKLAQKFLRLANRIQPSDKNILRLLAEAELNLGRYDESIALFQQVVQLDPSRHRTKSLLAWLLATSPYENNRNADKAIEIIDPLVDLYGNRSPATLEIYAACLAENGQYKQALKIQNRAIGLVGTAKTADRYTEQQKKGLMYRQELYQRGQAYRTADISQTPIGRPGANR